MCVWCVCVCGAGVMGRVCVCGVCVCVVGVWCICDVCVCVCVCRAGGWWGIWRAVSSLHPGHTNGKGSSTEMPVLAHHWTALYE